MGKGFSNTKLLFQDRATGVKKNQEYLFNGNLMH